MMALAQQFLHLLLDVGAAALARLNENRPDGGIVGLAGSDDFLLRGADRHQDDIVLILAGGRLPFGTRVPTTVNGTVLMRRICPTRFSPLNRLSITVLPSSATFEANSTSLEVNGWPLSISISRISR